MVEILKQGRINVLLDGQFGSTGKGLLAGAIADMEYIDVAATNNGPNSGHTCIINGKKIVAKQLPIAGIVNPNCQIYLCAGAVINKEILFREMEEYNISPERILIHPRAAIISEEDIAAEVRMDSLATQIASTRQGVGEALARKIRRDPYATVGFHADLCPYLGVINLRRLCGDGGTTLMEVPQGMDLSINSCLDYPHCTSREIGVAQALSDLTVHPDFLGNVLVCLRTFPIRVGNLGENNSGACYPDQVETTWDKLGLAPERTTVTNRERRVFTWSWMQYSKMLDLYRPDVIFVNFMNYLKSMDKEDIEEYASIIIEKTGEVLHKSPIMLWGIGPDVKDIYHDFAATVKSIKG